MSQITVDMIKSIPNNTLDKLKQTILDGYIEGKSVREMKKAIREDYNISKRDAELLARN